MPRLPLTVVVLVLVALATCSAVVTISTTSYTPVVSTGVDAGVPREGRCSGVMCGSGEVKCLC